MDISIELVQPSDTESVIKFLKDNFFKDEPMNAYLDLGECRELEQYSVCCINDGLSFKGVDRNTGEILGINLSAFKYRPVEKELQDDVGDQYKTHKKFYNIIRLTSLMDKEMNIFDRYGRMERVVEGRILCVSKKTRGTGMAGRLIEATLNRMREVEVPLFYIQCSGFYSARVMEKLDFEEVCSIKYNDFLIEGKQVLTPASPHESFRCFIKWAFKD